MSDEWVVRKTAQALRPGDRFIFTEEMGGEGEALTVVAVSADMFGIMEIEVEEFDWTIDVVPYQMLTIDVEKEEEA